MWSVVQDSRQRETLQPAALSSAQLEQLTETLLAVSLLASHMRCMHCSKSSFPGGMEPDPRARAWSGAV